MEDIQYRELNNIVKEVLEKRAKIIPIIGDDCFCGYINGNMDKKVTLQEWVAAMILGDDADPETIKKIALEGYRGLDILFEEYKRINEDTEFLEYKDSVCSYIEEGIKERSIFLKKDVKDFLNTAKFEVVATTCPFPILEKELTYIDSAYNVCSFSPASPKREMVIPTIYKIFGDCNKDVEFVLREDELLKFLHYLNRCDSSYKCSLAKYMEDKGGDGDKSLGLLMPIGCNNLPNWLFRFLWYPFSYKCLTLPIGIDQESCQGGIWHKHSSDEDFFKFLRKSRFKTVSKSTEKLNENNSDEDPVLNILTEKIQNIDRNILEEVRKIKVIGKDDWDIFISYASEDFDIAESVYNILTKDCKKNVWFDDRRIKPGDLYWEAIHYGIKHSRKFIFIITESYLNKAINESSGVKEELKRIKYHFLRKRIDGRSGYSFPIIIDKPKVTYTKDGKLHHETLTNGTLEKLYHFKEYKELQEPTEILFSKKQDLVCPKENLRKELIGIF